MTFLAKRIFQTFKCTQKPCHTFNGYSLLKFYFRRLLFGKWGIFF